METPFKHLAFFVTHISKTLSHFKDKELTETQMVCIGLLERLRNISIQLNLTLGNIEKLPHLEFSAGILIRAIILDNLISLSLFKLLADCEKDVVPTNEINNIVKEYCNRILSDGLSGTLSYAELSKELNFHDEGQIEKAFNNFAITYQGYINPHLNDGSKPVLKFKRFPNAKDLFKELAKTQELRELSKIYDAYLFYSKYDHFGVLYFDIINVDHSTKIKKLDTSINLFVRHQAILHGILFQFSNEDSFLKSQYDIAGEYLLSL